MAILIVISFLYFNVETTAHSWLGIIIVLTTTYCYMNIALRMPLEKTAVKTETEKARLLEEGDKTDEDVKVDEGPERK